MGTYVTIVGLLTEQPWRLSLRQQEVNMSDMVDRVDGWEIRHRDDGGYGVSDAHGLVAGPYGTREEAMAAALRLPRPRIASSARPAEQTPNR
jgi:hypothetical protein